MCIFIFAWSSALSIESSVRSSSYTFLPCKPTLQIASTGLPVLKMKVLNKEYAHLQPHINGVKYSVRPQNEFHQRIAPKVIQFGCLVKLFIDRITTSLYMFKE